MSWFISRSVSTTGRPQSTLCDQRQITGDTRHCIDTDMDRTHPSRKRKLTSLEGTSQRLGGADRDELRVYGSQVALPNFLGEEIPAL